MFKFNTLKNIKVQILEIRDVNVKKWINCFEYTIKI